MESKRRDPLVSLLIFLAFVVFPPGAFGQTSGTITGIVTDQSGASIPNAIITVTNVGTGVVARTLKTGADGIYVAEALPVGTYQIAASAAGFQRATSARIVLNVADRVSVNFRLKLASSTQTVEVTAAIQQVETQTGELSHTVSTEQITQLPILDRNFMELQQVVPGATKDSGVGDEIGKGFYGERGYAVNGFDQHYTGYQLDGVQNTDMGNQASTMTNPGPDTLAEFKVLTSNYSAKYGTAGGAELLAVTKSGTKEFHGDAYDFVRNDALDANSFFLNKANVARPPFHYNDYGYTIGGPFYIPGHYNTDKTKTFFFWDQEWIRESTESPLVAATPTVAMRNGDFTGVGPLTNPTDPLTGQPLTAPGGGPCVTGSQINPACINNNVRLLFNQDFPTPNSPGFFNFITGARSGQNWGEQMIRVDQNFSEKIKAFVRFIHDSWLENDPTVQWSGDAFPTLHSQFNIPSRNFIAKVSTIISPSLLNEISYNYASNYPASSTPAMTIQGAYQLPSGYSALNPFNPGFNVVPDMSFSQGYGGISALWGPWWAHHNISQASDDLTKEAGAHSLQMGVTTMFSITPVQSQTSPSRQGAYSFDGHFTGNAIADALLGLPVSYGELQGFREPYYNFHQTEAYFQDDWKATRRLTLNLGLRYFFIPHVYGQNLSMFLPTQYNPAQAPTVLPNGQIVPNSGNLLNGIIISGKNGTPLGLVKDHWNTPAPRFGFAWDPTGSGKTAIRGGYGIGYYRIEGNDVYRLVGNPPFSSISTFFNPPFDNPAAGVAAPLTPLALNGLDPIYDIPTVQNWSLNIQRQLSPNTTASIAYVGSRGTHLDYVANINQPLPAMGYQFDPRIACTATTPFPCQQRVSTDYVRPFQGWSGISNITPVGKSIYHSLQINVQRRFSEGLTYGVAYTYSKTMALSGAEGLGSGPQNPYNLRAEYGPAAFNRAHVLVFNYVYNLPFFHSLKGAAGSLLGGWEATGLVTLETGFPLTVGYSSPTQGLATRPNAVQGQHTSGPGTVAQWFNTSAYIAPPFGFYGNTGVGTIWGPPMNSWDLGFFKNFRVHERMNLQFRAEMFNIWNTVNFNSVDTTLGTGGFGQVTSTYDPRIMQLALKLTF
ncbi:MAG TPA: TonB-dependent receptor [Terriglobia bacterium]|nr:TonB-dependent receptor [Terriglobia bacterium]